MPMVTFTEDFYWRPKRAVTIHYKAGSTKIVTTACARAAKAAGKGREVPKARGRAPAPLSAKEADDSQA